MIQLLHFHVVLINVRWIVIVHVIESGIIKAAQGLHHRLSKRELFLHQFVLQRSSKHTSPSQHPAKQREQWTRNLRAVRLPFVYYSPPHSTPTVRLQELLHVIHVVLNDLSSRQPGTRRVIERLVDVAENERILHHHSPDHHATQLAM